MYKDKAKQREANRKIQAKRRKGVTKQGVTQGVTGYGNGTCVTPEYPQVSDQDFTKLMAQAGPGHVRVSKPGDADYEPQCETTRAFVEDRAKRPSPIKQVKVFEDLPPDVQQTIDIMSVVEGKIGQTIKANRTAIAIHYQHVFPGRY